MSKDERIADINKALKQKCGYFTTDGLTIRYYDRKGGVFLSRTFPSIEELERFCGLRKRG